MRFVPRNAWPLLPLLLFACREQPSAPVQQRGPAAGPPGLMEITITGIGTPQQKASARSVNAGFAESRSGGAAQGALSRGERIVLGPGRLTTLPDTATTFHDGSVQISPVSTASFTWGVRGSGGYRYVSATYRVRNASSSSDSAYADARTNLTFVAVNTPSTLSGTAISTLKTFAGTAVAAGVETTVLPTGWADLSGTATLTTRSADVLQVYTEDEVGSLALPSGVNSILPYGFVVSNPSTSNSRTLAANPDTGQYDGLVTFAFKVPLQPTAAEDPFSISVMFLPVDDQQKVVTQSFEEADATSVSNAAARITALGATARSLIGTTVGGSAATFVCTVRTAGTALSPTGFLAESISVASLSPTPYNGAASFLTNPVTLSATFSQTMAGASSSNFVVNSFQRGRAFVGGSYTGATTTTLGTPSGSFLPGDQVEVTLAAGLQGTTSNARVCTPTVYRYRIAATAASGPDTAITAKADSGNGLNVPITIAVGDLNGDGKLDVVAGSDGGDSVSVFLGNGTGNFTPAATSSYVTGNGPRYVALADLNGDGKLDLITANELSNNITVRLGDGAGGFGAATTIGVGTTPEAIAVGDVNGDGKLDILVANFGSSDVTVLLGNGSGGFTAASGSPVSIGAAGSDPYSIAVGDLNNDGKLDFVTANKDGNSITVMLGNGSGGFTAASGSPIGTGGTTLPFSVALADFNGDGNLDIAAALSNTGQVAVMLGNGNGTFGSASLVTVGANPHFVAVGDVNGDGKLDFVTANFGASGGTASVMLGDGSGGFNEATGSPYTVGSDPTTAVVADVNGDGKLDILVATILTHNAFAVLLNQ